MICLGLVALLTFGTAFVFDPKIGMARDWDLYAFTGLPLGLLLPDKLLTTSLGRGRSAVIMFGAAGLAVLAVRVAVLTTPTAAIEQNLSFLYLDPIRNHNDWGILIKYHLARGDTTAAEALDSERESLLPEERRLAIAMRAMKEQDLNLALQMCGMASRRYRGMPAYHAIYGASLLHANRLDQALEELTLARALNPYNPAVLVNLGVVYVLRGDVGEAERLCRQALEMSPNSGPAIFGMAMVQCQLGVTDSLPQLLERGVQANVVRHDCFTRNLRAALQKRQYALAARGLALGRVEGMTDREISLIVGSTTEMEPYLQTAFERVGCELGPQ